jgi:hypothetical protein
VDLSVGSGILPVSEDSTGKRFESGGARGRPIPGRVRLPWPRMKRDREREMGGFVASWGWMGRDRRDFKKPGVR